MKYLRNVLHENDLLACRLQWTLEERLPNFVWIERFLGLIGLSLMTEEAAASRDNWIGRSAVVLRRSAVCAWP